MERIEKRIFIVRGEKVMLDAHLAELYEVETRALLQAIKRNIARFPADFMFQLNDEETDFLRSQIVISKNVEDSDSHGGRRYNPYVFTEHGVSMLSSVLKSPKAIAINIEIIRVFVSLRNMIASHAQLARKLAQLESKYDAQFKSVFDAIRALMAPPEVKKKKIGFGRN